MLSPPIVAISCGGLHFRVHEPQRVSRWHAPVLLLHGWLGSSLDMHALALTLREAQHTVFAVDLPMHALSSRVVVHSPRDAARCIASAAAEVIAARVDQRAPPVVVMGYSLGGRVALELVCDEDCRRAMNIAALVLISAAVPVETMVDVDANDAVRLRHAQLGARLREFTDNRSACRDWLVDQWYCASMWGNLRHSSDFDNLVSSRIDTLFGGDDDRLGAVADAASALAPCNMTASLDLGKLCDVGVLYVYGELDEKYASLASEFAFSCSRVGVTADTVRILGAGHNVLVEKRLDVMRVLERFACPIARGTSIPISLCSVRVMSYRIPLHSAMRVGNQTVACRSGFLVILSSLARDSDGESGGPVVRGIGDVAPLPGLHCESLRDCYGQVEQWAESGGSFGAHDLRDPRGALRVNSLYPSVHSALESALMQCIAGINGMRVVDAMRALFGRWDDFSDTVNLNGVAPRSEAAIDSPGATSDVVARLLQTHEGTRVLKLKVGMAGRVDGDAAVVNALAVAMRKAERVLRLDANCSWTDNEYASFCSQTQQSSDLIEFVEEPLAWSDRQSLLSFCERSSGVGLDESLIPFSITDTISLVRALGVSAVVLKPSMQGSIYRMAALADAARARGAKVVLSSVFDSGVGLAWVSLLAATLGHPSTMHHGIGTYTLLSADCVTPGFEASCVSSTNCPAVNIAAVEAFLASACLHANALGAVPRQPPSLPN
jgi:o-succinylbenzoate synthase